jgi:hypothetical protein
MNTAQVIFFTCFLIIFGSVSLLVLNRGRKQGTPPKFPPPKQG